MLRLSIDFIYLAPGLAAGSFNYPDGGRDVAWRNGATKVDKSAPRNHRPELRWQVPLVLFVSFLIAFFDRMNISYALPHIARDYGWTVSEVGRYGGLVMSVFYVAYGLANILLSPLGARFGPRKSLMVVVVLFSVFTALSAPVGLIFGALLLVRILLGLSEAVHVPMMNVLTKKWFPVHERSRANAIWLSGLFLSMVLAPLVIVPLTDAWGWRAMFLILGAAGLLITLPLLYFFIYDSPRQHPGITPEEIAYIEAGLEKGEPEPEFWAGVRDLLKNKAFLVTVAAGVINSMVAFGLFSWIPTYFTEGRGLPFSDLAWATSIPYLFSVVGLLFWAWLGDRTGRRVIIAASGFGAAGLAAYFAATAPTIRLVVVLFCLTIFISVTWASGEWAIMQRIVPQSHIAVGSGIYNGVAMMIGGGLGPIIVGGVVSATGNYTYGILSLTCLCFLGGAVMLFLWRYVKY